MWSGRLIFAPNTTGSLLNQIGPESFQVTVALDADTLQAGFRLVDEATLLGTCAPTAIPALAGLSAAAAQSVAGGTALHFLLTRA